MKKLLILLLLTTSSFAEILDIPTGAKYEIGFSHKKNSTAQNVIIKAIDSSTQTLLIAAYSFTSSVITDALLEAKKRGVSIKVVLSESGNLKKDGNPTKSSKIPWLVENKIPFKVVPKNRYAIMHNKFIVIDDKTVETGSFNYSKNAHQSNAENVIVIYDAPSIALIYKNEFEKLWNEGKKLTFTF